MHFLRENVVRATCASFLLAVLVPATIADTPISSDDVNNVQNCGATLDQAYNSTLESLYEQDYELQIVANEHPLAGRSRISRGLKLDTRQSCGTCPSGYSCCGTKKCCPTGNVCVENYQVCCANDGSVPCGAVCCPKGEFCNAQAQCRASTTTVNVVATVPATSYVTLPYVVSLRDVATNIKTEQSTSIVTVSSAATATDWTTVTISSAPKRRARAVVTPTNNIATSIEAPVPTLRPDEASVLPPDFEVNDSQANTCTQEHHILRKRQQQQTTVTKTTSTSTQWVAITVVVSTTLRATVTTEITTTQWQTRTTVLNAATTVRSTTTTNIFRVQSVGSSAGSSPTGSSNRATDTGTPTNPNGNGGGGLSTGAKAGIGAGLGAAALAAIAAFFLWRRSRNKNKHSLTPTPAPVLAGSNEPPQQSYYGNDKHLHDSTVSPSYPPSSPPQSQFTPSHSPAPGPYVYEAPGDQTHSTHPAGYHEMGQGMPRQGPYHGIPPQDMHQYPAPQEMYQHPAPQEMGPSPVHERGYRG